MCVYPSKKPNALTHMIYCQVLVAHDITETCISLNRTVVYCTSDEIHIGWNKRYWEIHVWTLCYIVHKLFRHIDMTDTMDYLLSSVKYKTTTYMYNKNANK